MTTAFITWDVSPDIFHIGSYSLKWYGLLFASAFVVGYLVLQRIFPKEKLTIKDLDNLALYVGIAALVGARLGHCFFYQPDYFLANPLEILMVWKGGLASHGAAIAIIIALWLYHRKYKFGFLRMLDLLVLVVPLGGMFIRLGNLMNSEIVGSPTELPWGFIFLRADVDNPLLPRHPSQLYEAIAYLLISIVLLLVYYKTQARTKRGFIFGLFLVLLFGFRFFVEFIKEDQVAFESGMSFNMGQWLSLPFLLLGIGLMVYTSIQNKRTHEQHN